MTTTLTKAEILNETVKYYSEDTTRRAMANDGSCMYNTEDNKFCAVGRCFNEEYKLKGESLFSGKLATNIPNLNDKLETKYKGHEAEFWYMLQRLHDDDENWNVNGLAEHGEITVKNIKTTFKITE